MRSISGSTDIDIKDVQIDSRKIKKGSLFIAVKGSAADGHLFIDKATETGATVIVCEVLPVEKKDGVVYVQVENSAEATGYIAANFFGQPSERMKVVGVTGTNGKTTIATLLYKLFAGLGCKCGLLSTVDNHISDTILPATHTTPDAISLNQ